ncbi:MAG: exo-alpha-sialidase, partial [Bacteroidales bacterium]|nr:exo-alpha-sialidase [Bacteroidales bacterium]
MRIAPTILALFCASALFAQTHIHSFDEICAGAPVLTGSHAGDTGRSSLEADFNSGIVMDQAVLGQQMLDYPRLKRLQDGSYILFYQPLKHGYHIYCSFSDDCRNFSKGQRIFEGRKFINGDGEEDDFKYATADAVQLKNGDILCFCIFHSGKHYAKHLNEFGLCMKRSTDGGKTWGPEQVLHTSVDWEPYPMVLDDGEILVFFTDSDWDWDPNSSGCSLLRSTDNGYTWTLQQQAIRQVRDKKAHVMQRSVGTPRLNPDSTRTVFTDQMPVVRVLGDSGEALAVTETETPDHKLSISFAWEDSHWPVTLTGNMAGPRKRVKAAFEGAGPYLAQFPSGETVMSY